MALDVCSEFLGLTSNIYAIDHNNEDEKRARVTELSAILTMEPDNEQLLQERFTIYVGFGAYKSALVDLDRLQLHKPECPKLLITRAIIQFINCEIEEALLHCDALLRENPEHLVALQHRAMIYMLYEDERAVLEKQKIKLLLRKTSVAEQNLIANTYLQLAAIETNVQGGQLVLALLYCEEVLNLQPRNPVALNHRLIILNKEDEQVFNFILSPQSVKIQSISVENIHQKIEVYNLIFFLTRGDLNRFAAMYHQAQLFMLLGQLKQAICASDNAIFCGDTDAGNLALLHKQRSLIHRMLGEQDEVKHELQIAQSFFSTTFRDSIDYITLAALSMQFGNIKSAVIYCNEAMNLDPDKNNANNEILSFLNSIVVRSGKKIIEETDERYARNLLHWAVLLDCKHLIRPLINGGMDANLPDSRGSTPALIAAMMGHSEVLKELIYTCPVNLDRENFYGLTPIYMAASNGYPQVIKILNDAGAFIDTPLYNGQTPLWAAVENMNTGVIHALIAAGANPNMSTPAGTPLALAQKSNHPNAFYAVQLLTVPREEQKRTSTSSLQIESMEKLRSMFFNEIKRSAALEQELNAVKTEFAELLIRVSNPDTIPQLSGYAQHGFMRSANSSTSPVETIHESRPEGPP